MSEWISVDDRLPEHGKHVLVWSDIDGFMGIGDGPKGELRIADCVFCSEKDKWYTKNKWRGRGDGQWFVGVTHWQPLPSPPED